MPGSFIDSVRSGKTLVPERKQVQVVSVDPDVDIGGLARVEAWIGGGIPPVFDRALGVNVRIHQHSKAPMDRAARAAEIMSRCLRQYATPESYVVIEGQRVYPNPDEQRQTVVAKANDLIMLAVVSGACYLAAQDCFNARIVLPQDWKGQQSKRANNKHTQNKLAATFVTPTFVDWEDTQCRAAAPSNHALDAMGMCLYSIDLLSRDMW